MVNIHLFCVGKLKEKHFAAACAEYEKRLGAFCKLTITELTTLELTFEPDTQTPTTYQIVVSCATRMSSVTPPDASFRAFATSFSIGKLL